ncbi:hypothetical protein AUEXF2481DRAFT_290270 [Aureobasidium subglaciale EXF-2481]|uniref:Secreted protein n=1 Tax=Aureobasidium subglaciale (strain EXF-2481) TaxID=1043005 RepID=A0A074Z4Y2_AURSE|nr:uncharacterized protein AUEXF2481DRAFT_290270 [Aureobasidium subglaciale EXF-2481]KEQ94036.1 hypothetical protein AUEXF2481DRAFT_290270 [Aureobasidium subglaciale EXF-2481]
MENLALLFAFWLPAQPLRNGCFTISYRPASGEYSALYCTFRYTSHIHALSSLALGNFGFCTMDRQLSSSRVARETRSRRKCILSKQTPRSFASYPVLVDPFPSLADPPSSRIGIGFV